MAESAMRAALLVLMLLCTAASAHGDHPSRRLLQSDFSSRGRRVVRLGLQRLESFSLGSMERDNLNASRGAWERIVDHDWLRLDTLARRLSSTAAPPLESSSALEGSKLLSSPVNFGSGGIYYTDINVGTPPRKFSLIMDTGSDLTWVLCNGGATSGASQPFDPQASSTYQILPCDSEACGNVRHEECSGGGGGGGECVYRYRYGDGSSTSGKLASETLRISSDGGYESFPGFVFGCGSSTQGSVLSESGLLGLSPGALSFPSQIGHEFGQMFSYCLLPRSDESAGGRRSSLVFGDEAMAHNASMQFTPIVDNATYFSVSLQAISIGGSGDRIDFVAQDSQAQPTIFDSGTTLTMLPVAVYSALKDAIAAAAGVAQSDFFDVQGLDSCFMGVAMAKFPALTFHFLGGADYVTPPQNYVIDLGNAVQCLALVASSSISIIGNIQQQDFLVLHDFGSQRIGFKPADCAAQSL